MPVNDELTSEQWNRYSYMRDHGHLDFLMKAQRCDDFFEGLQWNIDDLNALQLSRRPAITINKIIGTVSVITGEEIFNRAEASFRPKDGATSDTATALAKVYKHIGSQNQMQWVRSDMFADGIVRSRGFVDIRMEFDDNLRGQVAVTQLNSKNVLVDPDAEEYDPDKWNDVVVSKWFTPNDIAVMYNPDDAELLRDREGSLFPYGFDSIEMVRDRFGGNALKNSYYGPAEHYGVRRYVRVIDRQFKVLDNRAIFVDPQTGDTRPVPDTWDRAKIVMVKEKYGLHVVDKLCKRIKWRVTADNVLLHDAWSPYEHFTVVGYFPFFRYGRTVGIVENLLGPQELLNKTLSQELHVINTTANSGWKIKRGGLLNMTTEELEQHGASTGVILELKEITDAEKITPNQIPTGLERLSFKAEAAIDSVSLVSEDMKGDARADVAAKAIQQNVKRGAVAFSKVMDNLERTDYIIARNILSLIQEYMTEPRLITITHDNLQQTQETVQLNQETPEGTIVNDLSVGSYEIVITSVPFKSTMEDSIFDQALEMRKEGIQIPDDVLIEASHLPNKADIVKRMAAQAQSPEAQAAQKAQLELQQAEVTDKQSQAKQRDADAAMKAAKAGSEGDPQAEAALKQQEMELKRQEAAQEMQLEREKMEQELALKRELAEKEFALKVEIDRKDAESRRVAEARAAAEKAAAPQPTNKGAGK